MKNPETTTPDKTAIRTIFAVTGCVASSVDLETKTIESIASTAPTIPSVETCVPLSTSTTYMIVVEIIAMIALAIPIGPIANAR